MKICGRVTHLHIKKTNIEQNQNKYADSYQKLKSLLNDNNIGLHEIKKDGSLLMAEVDQFAYSDFKNLSKNIKFIIRFENYI